jgi:hypothetical protein
MLSRPQGHSAAGGIRSIEKIHLVGTWTRELPACSIVPQPTTLPRAPAYLREIWKYELQVTAVEVVEKMWQNEVGTGHAVRVYEYLRRQTTG